MSTEGKLRFWPPSEVIVLAGEVTLRPFGAFKLGEDLAKLEWGLSTTKDRIMIMAGLANLRLYGEVTMFKEIGEEAASWHDTLLSQTNIEVSLVNMIALRIAKTRWVTIAGERMGDLYLVAPSGPLKPKQLFEGIAGFLDKEELAFISSLEKSDLREACKCLLIGSATACEFIALRASESLLKRWYKWKTGKVIKRVGWGQVLDKLTREYPVCEGSQPVPPELSALGYLKLRRDTIAHPDVVSVERDAAITLLTVFSLIGRLRAVMPNTSPGPASQSEQGSNEP